MNGQKSSRYGEVEVSYPTHEQVREEKKYEIEEVCRDEHPYNYEKRQSCKEHMSRRWSEKKNSYEKVKEMLRNGESGFVSGVHIEASLKSEGSRRYTVSSTALAKGQRSEEGFDTQIALEFVTASRSVYEAKVNANSFLPKNKFRWNIQSLIDEPLQLKTNFGLSYGKKGTLQSTIDVDGYLEKTQLQKDSVKQSPEMKKCIEEIEQRRPLSAICEEVRHQASSANKINLNVRMTPAFQSAWFVEKLKYALSSQLMTQFGMGPIPKIDGGEYQVTICSFKQQP